MSTIMELVDNYASAKVSEERNGDYGPLCHASVKVNTPAQSVNQVLLDAVKANHEWHLGFDEGGGYHRSELCTTNVAALAAAEAVSEQQQAQGVLIPAGLERCDFDDTCDYCNSPEQGTYTRLTHNAEDCTEAEFYICGGCLFNAIPPKKAQPQATQPAPVQPVHSVAALPDCWVVVKDGRIIGTHDEPANFCGIEALRYVPAQPAPAQPVYQVLLEALKEIKSSIAQARAAITQVQTGETK